VKQFRFHHVAISVPSLQQAIDWYGHVFGYVAEKYFDIPPPVDAKAAMLRLGELRIEVFEPRHSSTLPDDRRIPVRDLLTHGTKHPAYRVDDIEPAMLGLQAKGVEIVFVIREKFGRGFFIRDCAGNLIEFVEEPNT
jgi:catechol 2,3-dioxygenase-like lactoylglutathione lyase family enzyme